MTFTNRFAATAMNRTNLSCSASMGMNCAYTAAPCLFLSATVPDNRIAFC